MKIHRRGVRHEVVSAACELPRDNVRAAEVFSLAAELEGNEDKQPRLQPSHYPALNEGCDEVPRRLRLKLSDLFDVGVRKQSHSTLVQFDEQVRRLGP